MYSRSAMDLQGKKVLVTGADGFIGSHLVEALIAEGASVRAFVLYNSFNSWGWLDTLPAALLSEIEVVTGDIRDPRGVDEAVRGCEVVFHLAALIAIPFSYRAPDSFVETNMRGTLNVLTAARAAGCARVLTTSTSEVYGTAQYVPIDEKHPLQGQSPYSATKIGADALAESFWRSFDLPVTVVRPFNTYGPRQSARAVIPTVITQLLSGAESLKLGRLDPIRDLTFVKDTARGFIEIAKSDKTHKQVINIATGEGHTVEKVTRTIMSIIGREVPITAEQERVRPADSEVERLVGSSDRLHALTGWRPARTLEEGLRETIDWFRIPEHLARYKPEIYNV